MLTKQCDDVNYYENAKYYYYELLIKMKDSLFPLIFLSGTQGNKDHISTLA